MRRAVLCCNGDGSEASMESRGLLSRALLASVLRVPGGRLYLVTRSASSSRVRFGTLALADTLSASLAGTSASVSALFVGHATPPPRLSREARPSPEEATAAE